MLMNMKRICVLCLALMLVLAAVPAFVAAEETEVPCTPVESKLDFRTMKSIGEGRNEEKTAENKEKVRQILIEAGAVDCSNLFLKGNFETIVNPGGYNKLGYYIQKVSALEGETLQNATLDLGYWICYKTDEWADAEQGYVQVWVSADNVNYEMIWEDNEGNGPAFNNSRKTIALELPLEEGQTEIYVKVCMEHWNTYEGAGVAYSNIYANVLVQPIETTKKPHEVTMVTATSNFNGLPEGEVTAEDIGAVEESNLYYGMEGNTLLAPRNGYEVATATWLLEAAEGEPLFDAVLTIVGRTWWIMEDVKNDHYLKVYASVDGVIYKQVEEFRSNDNADDTQRLTVDLSSVCAGYGQVYVKLEWFVKDSPYIFGIRSVSLTGNTAGIDPSGEGPTRMAVANVMSYTSLPVGEVSKQTLNAHKSANLFFGYNKTPLLTPSEAGEDAYVTWKLTAPEGEDFVDCHLTLVGRFGYVDASLKDTTVMKIAYSIDGEKSYNVAHEIRPTDDQSDTQQIVVDLSDYTYGISEVYVRVYWTSKDDPSAMGLRSASLVANAGSAYPDFTPELEDRVITDAEWAPFAPQEPDVPTATEPSNSTAPTTPSGTDADVADNDGGAIVWIIVVAAVVAVAIVVMVVLRKKK